MRAGALAFALLSLVLVGCEQKPGPSGPQGEAGAQGTTRSRRPAGASRGGRARRTERR
jgi:hypothetical protein